VRYTGLSLAYQVSAIVGGFTPLISLTFLQQSNGRLGAWRRSWQRWRCYRSAAQRW
jgi:hypothetical protein